MKLSDLLETIREDLQLDGHINWEDFGDLPIVIATSPSSELLVLSMYIGQSELGSIVPSTTSNDILFIDVKEK